MDANLFNQRMGYGAMWLTGPGVMGFPKDRKAAVGLLHEVRELGVTFIDTAYAYGPETNESIVAEALDPYDGLTIATKCGTDRSSGGSWFQDGRPERIREQVEGSLKRLNVETIDLLQLHAPDRKVPIEES